MNKSNYNDTMGMCPRFHVSSNVYPWPKCPLDEAYMIDVSHVLSLDHILYMQWINSQNQLLAETWDSKPLAFLVIT